MSEIIYRNFYAYVPSLDIHLWARKKMHLMILQAFIKACFAFGSFVINLNCGTSHENSSFLACVLPLISTNS